MSGQEIAKALDDERVQGLINELAPLYEDKKARDRAAREVERLARELWPDAEGEQLYERKRWLRDLVFAEAFRRRPKPPAVKKCHDPTAVQDMLITRFPRPVAMAFELWCRERHDAAGGFRFLLGTWEALVHYLAIVAVSDYLRGSLSAPSFNRLVLGQFFRKLAALGDYCSIVLRAFEPRGPLSKRTFVAELPRALFDKAGKPTELGRAIEALPRVRNSYYGHHLTLLPSLLEQVVEEWHERLLCAAEELQFLTRYVPVAVYVDSEEQFLVRPLVGVPLRDERLPEAWERHAILSAAQGGSVADDTVYLLAPKDRQEALMLYPLSLFAYRVRGSVEDLYVYVGALWRGSRDPRLEAAEFVTYNPGTAKRLRCAQGGAGEHVVAALLQRVGRIESSLGIVRPSATEADLFEPSLEAIRAEQEYHLKRFVGRETELRSLERAVVEARSGYVLVEGDPGIGKSALAAYFAYIHGTDRELKGDASPLAMCLLYTCSAGREVSTAIRCLLCQAARIVGAQVSYAGAIEQQRARLLEFMRRQAESRGGVAVAVVDGADEMGAERLEELLPATLPDHVVWIVVTRRVPAIEQVVKDLQQFRETIEVGPLKGDDIAEFLARRAQAGDWSQEFVDVVDAQKLCELADGNPLLLRLLLSAAWREYRARGVIDYGELPQELRQALALELKAALGVRQAAGTPDVSDSQRRLRLEICRLLSVAREPLGRDELSQALRHMGWTVTGSELDDAVGAVRHLLVEPERGRFWPFHEDLRAYVIEDEISPESLPEYERALAKVGSEKWRRGTGADAVYFVRYAVQHLIGAECLKEAAELLVEWDYIERRVDSGDVDGLLRDYAQVRKSAARSRQSGRWGDAELSAQLEAWHEFVTARRSALAGNASAEGLVQEAHNWAQQGLMAQQVVRRLQEMDRPVGAWLKLLNRPKSPQVSPCRLTVQAGLGRLTAMAAVSGCIVLGYDTGGVALWDVGAVLGRIPQPVGAMEPVTAIAASADARIAVTGHRDGKVAVWSLADASAKTVTTVAAHDWPVLAVDISADGRVAVSCSSEGTVRVWEVERLRCIGELSGRRGVAWAASVDPSGRSIAIGDTGGAVCVWDLHTERVMAQMDAGGRWVEQLRFSPDGQTLVAATSDGELMVWQVSTGTLVGRARHGASVVSLAFDPDGTRVVSGGTDGTAKVWTVDGPTLAASLGPHRAALAAVGAGLDSDNQPIVVTLAEDGLLRIWDLEHKPEKKAEWRMRHAAEVTALASSADGRVFVSASADGAVVLWRADGERLWSLDEQERRGPVRAAAVSADAVAVFWADQRPGINRCQWRTRAKSTISAGRGESVATRWPWPQFRTLAMAPHGGWLAAGTREGKISIWDLAARKVTAVLGTQKGTLNALAAAPNGKQVVSCGDDGRVIVWNVDERKPTLVLVPSTPRWANEAADYEPVRLQALAVSPDGEFLVGGGDDGTVTVWNLSEGGAIQDLEPYVGAINALAVSADGSVLACGGTRGVVQVYLRIEGDPGGLFRPLIRYYPDAAVTACTFLGPHPQLIVGAADGRLHRVELQGVELGPPIETAWREPDEGALAVRCPWCEGYPFREIPQGEAALGRPWTCPVCRRAIQLNSFVIDADWRAMTAGDEEAP